MVCHAQLERMETSPKVLQEMDLEEQQPPSARIA